MKLWFIVTAIVLVLGIGWYLLSPAFDVKELDEESPLGSMDEETRAEFERQMEEAKDEIIESSDAMSSSAEIISQGIFMPSAHEVEGRALLIDDDGEKILRFEDFETINGPKLHIYLSSELGNDDFVDLGEIKATKGNVNYEIPEGVDTEKYNKVLVWCKPFRVLFSYAELG